MPDMCKCQGGHCPFKENCARYKTRNERYSLWFLNIPYDKEKDLCKFFVEDKR